MAAQLNGSGYYRFRNAQNMSDYISIANDKFNYNTIIEIAGGGLAKVSEDAGKKRALECAGLYLKTDIHVVNDADCVNPGSVIYASKRNISSSSNDYNLIGQGTSLLTLTTGTHDCSYDLVFNARYAIIEKVSGSGSNTLYTARIELKTDGDWPWLATLMGYSNNLGSRYLYDDNGEMIVNESGSAANAKWYIEKVSHFNVQPEFCYGNKYYTTLYVPFAFKLSGQVEKAYVVTSISGDGQLNLETVATKGGTVPAGTPVLLECASVDVADCMLEPTGIPIFTEPENVISSDAPAASTATNFEGINLLKGNYYCNTDGNYTIVKGRDDKLQQTYTFSVDHYTTPTNSMYVLGITASGKLGMVKSTDVITGGNPNAMPANKAWIEYSGSAELVFPFTASIRGDVNRDGTVDVSDVSALVNIIQDRDPDFDYDYDAADLDGDGEYDVDDVTGIVNIIQGRE